MPEGFDGLGGAFFGAQTSDRFPSQVRRGGALDLSSGVPDHPESVVAGPERRGSGEFVQYKLELLW